MPATILGGIAQEATQQSVLDKLPALVGGKSPVNAENLQYLLTDDFHDWPSDKWAVSVGSGDVVVLDGNANGLTYLVISKSPFAVGNETLLTSIDTFKAPLEYSVGVSQSQRQVGQELSIELVDNSTPTAPIADIAISDITQTGTTLTVTTAMAHGLTPGMAIGIRDVADTRLNYGACVVATTPDANQFTVTSTTAATLPSVTIASINNSGFVYYRPRVGYASNGVSQILEGTGFTTASYNTRADGLLPTVSGLPQTLHGIPCASVASVVAINAANTYAMQPSSEFRCALNQDAVAFSDVAVDALTQLTARVRRNQILPNLSADYKMRFRFTNNKAFANVIAKIVSVTKTGTTTATITTDTPHNLTTSSWVQVVGIRNQTAFANHTAATQVLSVPSANTFTIAIGTAVTANSVGGFVALNNGGALLVGLAGVIQNASVAGGVLTLLGSSAWTTLLIGDTAEVIGCIDNATGLSLNVDGSYKVRSVNGTTLTLIPLANTTLPANFSATDAGGGVLKRSDTRLSFVRVLQLNRQRVEMTLRGVNDTSQAMPVVLSTTPPVSQGGVWNIGSSVPLAVTDIASAALTTTTTTAAITPTSGVSQIHIIPVTAVTGTTPTLDVSIEETDDGTNWYNIYTYPRITATGVYRSPKLTFNGRSIRYVQTVGGVSPSFTRAVLRLQSSAQAPEIRQMIDRGINPNVLNSTTTNRLYSANCSKAQLVVSCAAGATVEAQLQLEASDDGVAWYAVGTTIATVANNTVTRIIDNVSAPFLRARVSTAGTGAVLNNILIKAYQ